MKDRIDQQIFLIECAEWGGTRKWKVLSDRVFNAVTPQKFVNIFNGGSSVDSLFDWLLIERAVSELRREYEND